MNEYKEIIGIYPFLKPQNIHGEEIENFDYSWAVGIDDIPKGWVKLFLHMCDDIKAELIKENKLDEFKFIQIKEKYGNLRCYTNYISQEINDIIWKYEYISSHICCKCGKPADKMTTCYICPYCTDCLITSKYDLKNSEKLDKLNLILTIKEYDKSLNEFKTRTLDCHDIWERLFG